MTRPGGFIAGDVLTATDMNLLPGGIMGYAQVTADQASISAVADLTSLTVTWTAVSARRYRTSFYVNANSSTVVAGNNPISIFITDSSNTIKAQAVCTDNEAVLETMTLVGSVCETGLSGSTTRKLRAQQTGGGTMDLLAAATYPAYILVEDIGPA